MKDYLQKLLLKLEMKFKGSRLKHPVFNVNNIDDPSSKKSALLVYLSLPFHLKEGHPAFRFHQNLKQSLQIASVLGEFGYSVDVIDIHDKTFKPSRKYDLVMSHRSDISGLEEAIGNDTTLVYLSSGMNHLVHNENQRRRLEYLRTRRGFELKNLVWDDEQSPFLKKADALVGFGNRMIMDSWKRSFSGPRHGFSNYGFPAIPYVKKNWKEARRNFLFLGSGQQLGKGLDLLLEIFPNHPNLHLYICSKYKNEIDFCHYYQRELYKTKNIHPCGWIDIRGQHFLQLVGKCGFVVLPSCSEGSPGSVVNAMTAGLIPLLTREAGIDTEDFGFTFPDDRIETIESALCELAQLDADTLEQRSIATRHIAVTRFSENAFISRWREILRDIHDGNQKTMS
jgi:hypothetical protein